MERLEGKMSAVRRQISQICEEMRRIRKNAKLTSKLRKNRVWMMKEIRGKITIASLTTLKEKKISIIRTVKNQREKKKAGSGRFKTNQWFYLDELRLFLQTSN